MTLVLRLASSDLHDLYLRAKPHVRRIMNHAIFETIWAEPDEDRQITIRSKKASPLADLLAVQEFIEKIGSAGPRRAEQAPEPLEPVLAAVGAPESAKAPDSWRESGNFDDGWITEVMVGRAGIEPATLGLRGPCSAG
jgi:hypothetical protein